MGNAGNSIASRIWKGMVYQDNSSYIRKSFFRAKNIKKPRLLQDCVQHSFLLQKFLGTVFLKPEAALGPCRAGICIKKEVENYADV